jgi:response regulator RpfG family c-di-GMP phosphodiesterase
MERTNTTVVAVIDDREAGRDAVAALSVEQFAAEVFIGEEGLERLRSDQEEGVPTVVAKMAMALGDEVRIMQRLEAALKAGASVVSVAVTDDQAARVATILEEHDAHDMWRLGEWSFNRIGSQGSGEG